MYFTRSKWAKATIREPNVKQITVFYTYILYMCEYNNIATLEE